MIISIQRRLYIALLTSIAFVGCGGGGGGTTGPPALLVTSAPSATPSAAASPTVAPKFSFDQKTPVLIGSLLGTTAMRFAESGGTAEPFILTSSNGQIVTVSGVTVENQLIGSIPDHGDFVLTPIAPGTATVVLTARNGDSVVIPVTVTTLQVMVTYNNVGNALTQIVESLDASGNASGFQGPLPSPVSNGSSGSYGLPAYPKDVASTVRIRLSDGVSITRSVSVPALLVEGHANSVSLVMP